jgi:hypothetical protein
MSHKFQPNPLLPPPSSLLPPLELTTCSQYLKNKIPHIVLSVGVVKHILMNINQKKVPCVYALDATLFPKTLRNCE